MKLTNCIKTTVCLIATAALVGCVSPGSNYTRSTGRTIDDNATTSRIKSSLGKDSLVKGTKINVSTYRGNVQLTGLVDHPIQKERASQITRNVEGVEWFRNDIVVINELPTMKEKAAMMQMRESAGAETQQKGANGAKWQQGTAGSLEATEASASQIQEPSGASSDLSQRVNGQLRSDASAQNVQAEAADNGKITLRGTVSSENEKEAIERLVKSVQGVSGVDNQLEVKNQ